MARSASLKANKPKARRQKKIAVRSFPRSPGRFSPLQLPSDEPKASFVASNHVTYKTRPHFMDKGKNSGIDLLKELPLVKFPSKTFPEMDIASWKLSNSASSRYEGDITEEPRDVVDAELVQLGNKHSGIFRLISTFDGPNGKPIKKKGTAFAIGKFHWLTSGHIMWDEQLGPAKKAVLRGDVRSQGNTRDIECTAAAVHARWIKFHQLENDFCMLATAEGLYSGVYPLYFGAAPSCPREGTIIGFPSDLPTISPGSQLIECRGCVRFRRSKDGDIFIHMINTNHGSSGSPLCIIGGKVSAVHSSFNSEEMENYAVPINLNGNDVLQFQGVLRLMVYKNLKHAEGVRRLGGVKYGEQEVFGFSSLTAPSL
ncbi:hypothetical protein GGR58DRAFT_496078 [Xylaria digitata]|nr:hypothetical protein GGR58DRAFT_496078 [Xylaria digitata]